MNFTDMEISTGGDFFKVEPGQPHDIRILQEGPQEKVIHGFGKTATICEGEGCLACNDSKPKQRFTVHIYDHTAGKMAKWEFGSMVAKQLQGIAKACMEEGVKINDRDLKVETSGSGLEKKWSVTPRMKSKALPPDIHLDDIPF